MISEQSQHIAKQIPDFLQVMEVTLRSGYNVAQSLEVVIKDLEEPIATELQQVLAEVSDEFRAQLP